MFLKTRTVERDPSRDGEQEFVAKPTFRRVPLGRHVKIAFMGDKPDLTRSLECGVTHSWFGEPIKALLSGDSQGDPHLDSMATICDAPNR